MPGFDLVEEDGSPSPDRVCPFCGGLITIGHYRGAGERRIQRGLTVVHGSVGTVTGCKVFDDSPGPEDFLEQALPLLIAAEALASVHGRPRA